MRPRELIVPLLAIVVIVLLAYSALRLTGHDPNNPPTPCRTEHTR